MESSSTLPFGWCTSEKDILNGTKHDTQLPFELTSSNLTLVWWPEGQFKDRVPELCLFGQRQASSGANSSQVSFISSFPFFPEHSPSYFVSPASQRSQSGGARFSFVFLFVRVLVNVATLAWEDWCGRDDARWPISCWCHLATAITRLFTHKYN